MAGLQLDGAGQVKMVTLEECLTIHSRTNALVEQYALSVKNNKPVGSLLNGVKRNLPSLAFKLKGQFGMISDLVNNVVISSSRGSSDVVRVRTLREGIAQIKQGIDVGMAHTKNNHAIHRAKPVAKLPAEG